MGTTCEPLSPQIGFLPRAELATLLTVLQQAGYTVVGPKLEQAGIVLGEFRSVADLPLGYVDEQQPGAYRVQQSDNGRVFSALVGPQAWKKYLFPPEVTLLTVERDGDRWKFLPCDETTPRYAFLGMRACDVAALAVQDGVFMAGPGVDPLYVARRAAAFVIAVQCGRAVATCFCQSLGTGPRCAAGFDWALTELDEGFLLTIGSDQGSALAAQLPLRPASTAQIEQGAEVAAQAEREITRRLDTEGLRDLLFAELENPEWEKVGNRCLACGNCTQVCPTCFCSTVAEVSDVFGTRIERQKRWDSCFRQEFSHIHGGPVRDNIRNRYRQWLTHKLAGWQDQFGVSGCVGCGRCITWCPVGIDLTAECAALREDRS